MKICWYVYADWIYGNMIWIRYNVAGKYASESEIKTLRGKCFWRSMCGFFSSFPFHSLPKDIYLNKIFNKIIIIFEKGRECDYFIVTVLVDDDDVITTSSPIPLPCNFNLKPNFQSPVTPPECAIIICERKSDSLTVCWEIRNKHTHTHIYGKKNCRKIITILLNLSKENGKNSIFSTLTPPHIPKWNNVHKNTLFNNKNENISLI